MSYTSRHGILYNSKFWRWTIYISQLTEWVRFDWSCHEMLMVLNCCPPNFPIRLFVCCWSKLVDDSSPHPTNARVHGSQVCWNSCAVQFTCVMELHVVFDSSRDHELGIHRIGRSSNQTNFISGMVKQKDVQNGMNYHSLAGFDLVLMSTTRNFS